MVTPLETVQYEMGDDYFVTVTLDPNLEQTHHNFNSLEAHDQYLLNMEENGEKLIVNKAMYEELSHYFDPYMIAIMDMNRTVTVADTIYKATKEAAYRKAPSDNDWQLHIFYGESGKVDLEETALVYENIKSLDKLKNYNFKSPLSKKIYDIKNSLSPKARLAGRDIKYVNFYNENEGWYWVNYKDSPTGKTYTSILRWYCWNDNYQSWGARAKGATITQRIIYIARNNEVAGTDYSEDSDDWSNLTGTAPLGTYHMNGTKDKSQPYTYVKIQSSKGSKSDTEYRWQADIDGLRRKSGGSAQSYHTAGVRENNSNTYSIRMHSVMVH